MNDKWVAAEAGHLRTVPSYHTGTPREVLSGWYGLPDPWDRLEPLFTRVPPQDNGFAISFSEPGKSSAESSVSEGTITIAQSGVTRLTVTSDCYGRFYDENPDEDLPNSRAALSSEEAAIARRTSATPARVRRAVAERGRAAWLPYRIREGDCHLLLADEILAGRIGGGDGCKLHGNASLVRLRDVRP